ncbi:MAG: HAMP domain-containing sensor histidine kinase [Bacteroidota bacterium]|nr:HAMP domain-containing sensor histidine kinase [Bacteroidota bacterium]
MKFRIIAFVLGLTSLLSGLLWENYWKKNDAERQTILSENIYKRIEKNEKIADALLNDTNIINEYAVLNFEKTIADKIHENGFELLAFNGDSMVYWSTERVTIDSCLDDLRKGSTFLKTQNGIFQVYKKNKGYYNYLLLFLIKNEYLIQNKYLENELSEKWEEIENVKISLVKLPGFYEIKSPDGKYYFSFQNISDQANYPNWLKIIIILGAILLYFSIESFIIYFICKGFAFYMSLVFVLILIGVRVLQIHYKYSSFLYDGEIFSPTVYASNFFFPSLADFIINVGLACRLLFVVLVQKGNGNLKAPRMFAKPTKYIISAILLAFPIVSVYLVQTLIVDSTISLNFSNKSINSYTLYALLAVSLCCVMGFLAIRVIPTSKIDLHKKNVPLFISILFLFLSLLFWISGYIYLLGIALLVGLLFIVIHGKEQTHLHKSFFSLIMSSVIIGLLFSYYNREKENASRRIITQNIYERRDGRAERLMSDIDKRLQNDFSLKKLLYKNQGDNELLKKRIKENYFTGYLGHYNISLYTTQNDSSYAKVEELDSLYRNNASQVENTNFSRINSSSTLQGYIARYAFKEDIGNNGDIYIVLQPKTLGDQFVQTELFSQSHKVDFFQNPDYSWCMYRGGKLFNNHGIYNYPVNLDSPNFNFKDNFFEFTENGYDHLAYNNNNIIIIASRQSEPFYRAFTYILFFVTFFVQILFIVFLLSTFFHFMRHIRYFFKSKRRYIVSVFQSFKSNYVSGGFNLSLLSNQIQLMLAFLIIITIVITAVISQQGIVNKFNENQNNKLLLKIKQIAYEIKNEAGINPNNYQLNELNTQVGKLSELYASDINLYDLSGNLLATSQPKIFEFGIMSNRINPDALQQLSYKSQSQFIHNENIGKLNYLSAYLPIIENNKIVAYINLPFFSKEAELETEIKSNIISLITPYSLIFIIISLFSYIISLRVSNSLNFIRLKIAQTTFGKKNNKLVWNKRDEIGALVRQYNLMIDKLEESAEMLARTERDQAWREMAKQIAHEIKNPLTPMKLNLQMLQRSAHENVSDLEAHVKRVSNLLIEQIDSLSQLAGEFSSFARMTEGQPQLINLSDVCKKIAQLYNMPGDALVNYHSNMKESIVLINPDAIQRAMNNLVKNGIQATKEGVEPIVDIYIENKESKALITIKDNGTGIPIELHNHIFEPNFSTKNSGMGLGLAIVKKIIERANGSIWFETEQNVGSTFYIELDLAK